MGVIRICSVHYRYQLRKVEFIVYISFYIAVIEQELFGLLQ